MTGHPHRTLLCAVVATLVLGFIDWATGAELSFSAFYLLPVTAVAWSNDRVKWVGVAILSAGCWWVADITTAPSYAHPLIPFWNTVMRLAVFLLVGALFAQLRRTLTREQLASSTDYLTGVLNSREFLRRGAELVARPGPGTLTVLFVDIDDFKTVNDTHGHSGGDEVLRRIGAALRGSVRSGDVVGRLGGDEFGLLYVTPTGEGAEEALEELVGRARDALRHLDPPVGFSAGAVTFDAPLSSLGSAIEHADRLMYEAKRSGKGALTHQTMPLAGVDQV